VGNTIHAAKKEKICAAFGMEYNVWEDHFYTQQEFLNRLDDYRIITNATVEELVIGEVSDMPEEEKGLLTQLGEQKPIPLPGNLRTFSPAFIWALVKKLKSNNQAEDALYALGVLASNERFEYLYYGAIHHLKAVLLSHDDIQKWDDAIRELRFLYKVVKYHLQDPEIITLMASNFKRKALYHAFGVLNHPDQVDVDMVAKALSLYRESYAIKLPENRYYDAINIAYLIAILRHIEGGASEDDIFNEIRELYDKTMQQWSPDADNWWEVSTQMEFMVLLKDLDGAAKIFELYEQQHAPMDFEIHATIRQLELFVHFTQDISAQEFLTFLLSL
jgi:hypothetical protein